MKNAVPRESRNGVLAGLSLRGICLPKNKIAQLKCRKLGKSVESSWKFGLSMVVNGGIIIRKF